MGLRKDAYVDEIKWKIDKWNEEIQEFQSKAVKIKADSQALSQREIEEIRAKRVELETKITELQHAGAGDWEFMKNGVDTAGKALEEAIHRARSKLK